MSYNLYDISSSKFTPCPAHLKPIRTSALAGLMPNSSHDGNSGDGPDCRCPCSAFAGTTQISAHRFVPSAGAIKSTLGVRSARGTRSVLEPIVTQTSPAERARTCSCELKSRAWLFRRWMWAFTASLSKPAAARSASVALKPGGCKRRGRESARVQRAGRQAGSSRSNKKHHRVSNSGVYLHIGCCKVLYVHLPRHGSVQILQKNHAVYGHFHNAGGL
jgi:hypothetical protein